VAQAWFLPGAPPNDHGTETDRLVTVNDRGLLGGLPRARNFGLLQQNLGEVSISNQKDAGRIEHDGKIRGRGKGCWMRMPASLSHIIQWPGMDIAIPVSRHYEHAPILRITCLTATTDFYVDAPRLSKYAGWRALQGPYKSMPNHHSLWVCAKDYLVFTDPSYPQSSSSSPPLSCFASWSGSSFPGPRSSFFTASSPANSILRDS
jgi:hypothetical protein